MTLSQGHSYCILYFRQIKQIFLLILGYDLSSKNLLQWFKTIFLVKKKKILTPKLFHMVSEAPNN